MTNEKLYEVLGDINEKYVKEAKEYRKAKKPIWFKWGAMAACLCFAVFGIFVIQHLGTAPSTTIEQPGNADREGQPRRQSGDPLHGWERDIDISADEWETVMEAFEQAIGMSYEEFTKKLPASYQRTAFYSIDVPTAPKSGDYIPHDYVFEFLTENDGEVKIAICADEEPLRDCFFLCENPKESKINGTTALIYSVQDSFMVQFSYDTVNYDIDMRNITLEEVENLLTCIIS